MKVDVNYGMCSYLAIRYVYDRNIVFKEGIPHIEYESVPAEKKVPCEDANDIDRAIQTVMDSLDLSKTGILLSGGMDSAILASYLPAGSKAYTARCIGENAIDETEQAKKYCDIYNLKHIVIDVTWDDYVSSMGELIIHDGQPITPNEPQAYKLAKQAKKDGLETLLIGDAADTEYGGMNKLLSKDWGFDEWIKRYQFVDPSIVLRKTTDISGIYEDYRQEEDGINFIKFIAGPYSKSAASAYANAIDCAGMRCVDPFDYTRMAVPLDIKRVRSGESKYLIRDLFKMKYPALPVPEKIAMGRPADDWMKNWDGPVRKEFIPGCVKELTGEQKLLVFSLERFLNLLDEI